MKPRTAVLQLKQSKAEAAAQVLALKLGKAGGEVLRWRSVREAPRLRAPHIDANCANVGQEAMALEIVKEPYLEQLRTEVAALKRFIDGEPDQIAVARAWASLGKITEALRDLCPNHPHILEYRR